MPSIVRRGIVGAGFALLGVFLVSWTFETRAEEAEVSAIRTVLDRQTDDWNKGDLDAFLEGYWKSPKVVFQSGGDRNVGFEAMKARYFKRYKAEGKAMGRVTFSDVEIEPLGPDSAFVRGRWGLVMADGKTPGGLFTLIFRKLPEGWKIVHDHTSAAPDLAVPPAPVVPTPVAPAKP